MSFWKRAVAGCWFGHDLMVKSTTTRVYLACDLCGSETEGWPVESATFTPYNVVTRKKLKLLPSRKSLSV